MNKRVASVGLRVCLVVLSFSLGLSACELVTGGDPEPASSEVPAGEMARAFGIHSYELSLDRDSPLRVDLRDENGNSIGTYSMEVDLAGQSVTTLSAGGASATLAIGIHEHETAPLNTIDVELSSGENALTIVFAVDTEDGADWVKSASLQAALPSDWPLPESGGLMSVDDGVVASLAMIVDGTAQATEQEVLAWMGQVGLGTLQESRAATLLFVVQRDEALAEAVQALADAVFDVSGEGTSEHGLTTQHQGIHTTPVCSAFFAAFGASAGFCCSSCGVTLPALLAGGWSVLFTGPACVCCTLSIGVSALQGMNCARSYYWRTTEEYCASEFVCPHSWEVPKVSADGHSCWCDCDDVRRCPSFCSALSGNTGIALVGVGGACTNNVCNCNFDPDAYCSYYKGEHYCGDGYQDLNTMAYVCPNACGNGVLDTTCADNPAYTEACDGSAADGNTCEAGFVCDQCRCRPGICGNGVVEGSGQFKSSNEQCEWQARDCPDGEVCIDCACQATLASCFNNTLDTGEECDLSAAGGDICIDPEVCVDCRCTQRDPPVCGDGVCDTEAGEQVEAASTYCQADCPAECGDGLCNHTAGEASSCPEDCGEVQCCVDTGGCPSEERYSCPGECCCCPSGAVCAQASGAWVCGF